jgi:Papain family cysteine protease
MTTERRFGGPNGYGHKGYELGSPIVESTLEWFLATPGPARTPFVHLARRLGLSSSPTPRDLRQAVLDPNGPGIFDQTSSSACTGEAEVGATMTRLVLMGTPAPYKLSPFDAYRKGRRIDIPLQANGQPQPLVDDGAIPEQVTRACAEWGICSYASLPNDPSRVNEEPTQEQLEQGLRAVVQGIYGLTGDVELQTQASIAAGHPVKLGSLVGSAFENWTGGDPIGPEDPSTYFGGHAMYVCGTELVAGVWQYILGNSWGPGVGESGFFRVTGAWLRQASDLEVADIRNLEAA